MDLIYIGRITSTHGIKGELKIKSDFQYKSHVFHIGSKLIIKNEPYIIKSYRVHKGFDMVCLNDFKDINEVLYLKGEKVYFREEDLSLGDNEILDSDLIKYLVVTNDLKNGIIEEVFYASSNNKILRVLIDNCEHLIPFNSPMIEKIDKDKKVVYIRLIDGM